MPKSGAGKNTATKKQQLTLRRIFALHSGGKPNEALLLAIENNNCPKAIAALVRKGGADINAMTGYNPGEPMLCYAIEDNYSVSAVALIRNGANVDKPDQYKATPLHHAVWQNNEEIVKALLKAGAKPNVKNEDGYSPLQCSIQHDATAIAVLLVNHGAVPPEKFVADDLKKHKPTIDAVNNAFLIKMKGLDIKTDAQLAAAIYKLAPK